MHNISYLIGRLTEEPKSEEGKVNITLAVTRSYKNADGIYETDFVPVVLFNGIATNTANYCHKDDLMAVRGRLQIVNEKLVVVAEKVTFLASKKQNEEEGE